MNKKLLFLIPTALLIIFAVLFVSSMVQDKKSVSTSSDSIQNLINNSLSIQYGTDDIDLNTVFTKEFIDNLEGDSNFDKEKLAPYQIVYKNYRLNVNAEDEYTVSVHIKDKNGRYIQVIHVEKEKGNYKISMIEYDI